MITFDKINIYTVCVCVCRYLSDGLYRCWWQEVHWQILTGEAQNLSLGSCWFSAVEQGPEFSEALEPPSLLVSLLWM